MKSQAGTAAAERARPRPEHFSTYVPRDLVRRLKVVATILDTPLWRVVTQALEEHLERFEKQHRRLPKLANGNANRRD
jgi:hypothetical protein